MPPLRDGVLLQAEPGEPTAVIIAFLSFCRPAGIARREAYLNPPTVADTGELSAGGGGLAAATNLTSRQLLDRQRPLGMQQSLSNPAMLMHSEFIFYI